MLGCLHRALRHVDRFAEGSSLNAANAANGDGERQNDGKECFHGTKVFVDDRSNALVRKEMGLFARVKEK
jgi:hypothetical protein